MPWGVRPRWEVVVIDPIIEVACRQLAREYLARCAAAYGWGADQVRARLEAAARDVTSWSAQAAGRAG